jgi:hypothetical protein
MVQDIYYFSVLLAMLNDRRIRQSITSRFASAKIDL